MTLAYIEKNIFSWVGFCVLLMGIFFCHTITIRSYPPPWGDEVHLLELGRCAVFERETDWSVILRPSVPFENLRPSLFPTYLSGVFTEFIFRMTGIWWAHRLFSLMGLVVAAVLCRRWLIGRGFSDWIAGCVALMFATEIHITRSVHFFRPDLWVLAMTFLCALRISTMSGLARRDQYWWCAGMGVLSAFQLLYWFAAIFSWPLIFAELFVLEQRGSFSWSNYFKRIGFVGMGGFFGLLVFLVIPFHGEIPQLVKEFAGHPDFAAITGDSLENSQSGAIVFLRGFLEHLHVLILLMARAPFLWAMAVIGIGAAFVRHKALAYLFFASILCVVATNVYCFRVIYLLPFAAFFVAAGLDAMCRRAGGIRWAKAYCFGALSFGIVVSAVMLNLVVAGVGDNHDRIVRRMDAVIGSGAKRVYIFSWQPYFIGRQLGWQMYSFLPFKAKYIFTPEASEFLSSMDYVVVQEKSDRLIENNDRAPLDAAEIGCLRSQGFFPVAEIAVPARGIESQIMIRLRHLVFAWEFPVFTVWKKQYAADDRMDIVQPIAP